MNVPARVTSIWDQVKASINALEGGSTGYIYDALASQERRIADLEHQVGQLNLQAEESQVK